MQILWLSLAWSCCCPCFILPKQWLLSLKIKDNIKAIILWLNTCREPFAVRISSIFICLSYPPPLVVSALKFCSDCSPPHVRGNMGYGALPFPDRGVHLKPRLSQAGALCLKQEPWVECQRLEGSMHPGSLNLLLRPDPYISFHVCGLSFYLQYIPFFSCSL